MKNYYIYTSGDYINGKYLVDQVIEVTESCQVYSVSFMSRFYTAMVWDCVDFEKCELPRNRDIIDSFKIKWQNEEYMVLIRPAMIDGTFLRLKDSYSHGRFLNNWEAAATIHHLAWWLLAFKQDLGNCRQYFDISLDNVAEYVNYSGEIVFCLMDIHAFPGRSQDESQQVKALAELLYMILTGKGYMELAVESGIDVFLAGVLATVTQSVCLAGNRCRAQYRDGPLGLLRQAGLNVWHHETRCR